MSVVARNQQTRRAVARVLRELEALRVEYNGRARPWSAYATAFEHPYAAEIAAWHVRHHQAEARLVKAVQEYLLHGRVRDLRRLLHGTPYSVTRQADLAWLREGSHTLTCVCGIRP